MSGVLVGEVIAASARLRTRGLSERGFHALIAIADRADTKTRVASVPLRHICAVLYGDMDSKQRTAERAIHDLKRAGVVEVVRRGYNNGHGRSAAPIYRIGPLGDTDMGDGNGCSDTDMGDGNDRATVSDRTSTVSDKPTTVPDKTATVPDTAVSYLTSVTNGFTNVSSNERDAREKPSALPPVGSLPEDEPLEGCPKHPHNTFDPCGPCGIARQRHNAWKARQPLPLSGASAKLHGWLAMADRLDDPDYESPYAHLFGGSKKAKRNEYIDGEVIDTNPVDALFDGRP